MSDDRQELRSLKRGLRALSLINQLEVISISELARKLALPRTTAERILTTLATEGYVYRTENDKRYRLSQKVCALARGFSDESWISEIAAPLLFDFTRQWGWPLSISTPAASARAMCVRITTEPATSLWLTRRRIGSEMPLLGSSAGLVYLARAEAGEREHLLHMVRAAGELPADTCLDLDWTFERILRDGFAFEPYLDAGEDGISLPILIDGRVRATLAMTFIVSGLRRTKAAAEYLPRLQALQAAICEECGEVFEDAETFAGTNRIDHRVAA
jgi:IclR family mhp operon transcriptional activator